ncbi:hypothetical protein [Nitrosomonas marina]|uniref:Uncharacterized protein n=1 Tax=Nitrosomonas marina TaxID=917 RepID=A0A1H8GJL4_9PROT|nr:hypothetical protein [Nitrosomonas marina]SEN43975.1 hypothetical protein SAMN05216325_11851 [Nitrosomonas marina]
MTARPLDYYTKGSTGLLTMNSKKHSTLYPQIYVEKLRRKYMIAKVALAIESIALLIMVLSGLTFIYRVF